MTAPVIALRHAKEEFVDLDVTGDAQSGVPIRMWVRTWGNREGIPVLFVHGGPGNCVQDYEDINSDFFDAENFYVVEPDQRGTGKSQPSCRDKVCPWQAIRPPLVHSCRCIRVVHANALERYTREAEAVVVRTD